MVELFIVYVIFNVTKNYLIYEDNCYLYHIKIYEVLRILYKICNVQNDTMAINTI